MPFKRMMNVPLLLAIAFFSSSISSVNAANRGDYKASGSISLIEKAFGEGKISKGERAFRDLQAIMAPQELPPAFRSASAELIKCGTPFVLQARADWALLTPDQQLTAAKYLARPRLDSVYISPESHFAIHYAISGVDSVPSADLDANHIPDYVERIGLYADSCYRHYRYNLGYLPPPVSGGSLYDIYLLKIGAYGTTVVEGPADSSWNDNYSYIQIHCTFANFPSNDDPEGDVIGAQKVTCAHEYYHATQLAYSGSQDLWWMEAGATFFEEVSFPVVNDNYGYLPSFFDYPDTGLTSSGYHAYGSFIWPMFLAERYGAGILTSIWGYARFYNSLSSTDSALALYGDKVSSAFPQFAVWNYFTGPRVDTLSYDSGAFYPEIFIDRVISGCPFSSISANYAPDGLAANYIVNYPNSTTDGLLRLDFDGSNSVVWAFPYITFKDGIISVNYGSLDDVGRTTCGIYDFARYDSIVYIPCVVTQWLDDNQYTFKTIICPPGDVNGSGDVNIQDITYLITSLYRSGPPPKYDKFMGDVDCDGKINIRDATYLTKFLYLSGPGPCFYHKP